MSIFEIGSVTKESSVVCVQKAVHGPLSSIPRNTKHSISSFRLTWKDRGRAVPVP